MIYRSWHLCGAALLHWYWYVFTHFVDIINIAALVIRILHLAQTS